MQELIEPLNQPLGVQIEVLETGHSLVGLFQEKGKVGYSLHVDALYMDDELVAASEMYTGVGHKISHSFLRTYNGFNSDVWIRKVVLDGVTQRDYPEDFTVELWLTSEEVGRDPNVVRY